MAEQEITPAAGEGEPAPEPAPEPEVEGEDADEPAVDYKAELERVKKEDQEKARKLAQAEHVIEDLKRKRDEEPPVPPPEEVEERIQAAVQEAVRPLRAELHRGNAESIAATLARNEDEKNLILYHWEHTVLPSGNLETDLKRAQLVANETRLAKESDELRAAALSHQTRGAGGGSPGQKAQPAADYAKELSPMEVALAKRTTEDLNRNLRPGQKPTDVKDVMRRMAEAKRG